MNREMKACERVFAVLDGKIPDRVPYFEMYVDAKVIDAIAPGMSYFDFADHVGLDAVCDLSAIVEPEIHWVDKANRIAVDKWGSRRAFTEDFIPFICEPGPIDSEADLASYTPPNPADPIILNSIRKLANRFKGSRAVAFVGEEIFAPLQYLRGGPVNLMFDFKDNPSLVKKLAKIGEEYHIELYRKVLKEGAEIILLGDDYAGKNGPFISPADFGEFILPGLTRIVREIKQAGGYVIKHTDGSLWPVLDQFVSTGLDALGPLEPVEGFDLDLIQKHTDHKVTVMGNINIDLLSRGTREQVVAATKACLAKAAPRGRHILSSANTISSSVNPDNLMAMIQTVQTFGRYPIS